MALKLPFIEPPTDTPPALVRYLEMWNETDRDQIQEHVEAIVSDDCVWVDPDHQHEGRDALVRTVRRFRKLFPGAELGLASTIDGHNGRFRYHWLILQGDEVLMRGFDVATINEAGLIERVDGFFGLIERLDPISE